MILETARLVLRPHRLEDAPFLMHLNSDPEVVRYTGNGPFADLGEAEAVIRRVMLEHERGLGRLMVEDRSTGERLGFCGLKDVDGEIDHGFRLLRSAWGKGIATEASNAVLDHASGELGLTRLVARAMPANVASLRVLEKLAFARCGEVVEDGATWVKLELYLGGRSRSR